MPFNNMHSTAQGLKLAHLHAWTFPRDWQHCWMHVLLTLPTSDRGLSEYGLSMSPEPSSHWRYNHNMKSLKENCEMCISYYVVNVTYWCWRSTSCYHLLYELIQTVHISTTLVFLRDGTWWPEEHHTTISVTVTGHITTITILSITHNTCVG